MPTLAHVMDDLTRRGFTEHFVPVAGGIRGVQSGRTFGPGEVTVAAQYRFEGVSDPDDMSVLYALETASGVRGTLADAFGTYADPAVGDFVRQLAVRGGPPASAGIRRPATAL